MLQLLSWLPHDPSHKCGSVRSVAAQSCNGMFLREGWATGSGLHLARSRMGCTRRLYDVMRRSQLNAQSGAVISPLPCGVVACSCSLNLVLTSLAGC